MNKQGKVKANEKKKGSGSQYTCKAHSKLVRFTLHWWC